MLDNPIFQSWKDSQAVIATMHAKEQVISPLLSKTFAIECVVYDNFDSDQFGTFTREIKRKGTQREAARAKAHKALDQYGHDLAIASEGSFASHPINPQLQINREIVMLVDAVHDIEITGEHVSYSSLYKSQKITSSQEALEVAQAWGFPKQGIIVRASTHTRSGLLHKDIQSLEALEKIVSNKLARFFTSSLYLETDMRAFRSPKRMEGIAQATHNLIERCLSVCPSCSAPGFWITHSKRGLACAECNAPTDVFVEDVYQCTSCEYQEHKTREGRANPAECDICNP